MDFLILAVGLSIFIAGVYYSRKMAESRGKSPLGWGIFAALFSPLLAIPILFFIPKEAGVVSASDGSVSASRGMKEGQDEFMDVSKNSNGFRAKPFVIAAAVALGVAYLLVLGGEANLKDEFQTLLKNNNINNVKVDQVETSMTALFGGRNDVDLILTNTSGEVLRVEALVVGSPLGYSYIEIPAVEMIKLGPLGGFSY